MATILSAQCTDKRVNMVTPLLFRTFPTAEALADAPQEKLEDLIRSTGFFRNKAKSLIGLGKLSSNDTTVRCRIRWPRWFSYPAWVAKPPT